MLNPIVLPKSSSTTFTIIVKNFYVQHILHNYITYSENNYIIIIITH